MRLYFLEIVFLGHEEVNIDNTQRKSRDERWNRFIKFVCNFMRMCVVAQTEGEYTLLILIKGSFFLSMSKDNTAKALGFNTLR